MLSPTILMSHLTPVIASLDPEVGKPPDVQYADREDRASGAHRRYARPGERSFFDSYTAMDKGHREGRPRQAFDKVQRSSAQSCDLESACEVSHIRALYTNVYSTFDIN